MDYQAVYQQDKKLVDQALAGYFADASAPYHRLLESMHYSLTAGGKRLRPILVLAFCRACGGDAEKALPVACALEMVHTYSLIHDDLPCMDDDDLRRGKPSNHKVFGEDIALLAGDALLTLAFTALTNEKTASLAGDSACRRAAAALSAYAGASGMVGGQVIDLISENKQVPIETIREIEYKKTACLIKAACELGCLSAGADSDRVCAASRYGECLGIAFQIQDDILDCTSTDEELGKPVGSDVENQKSTFVSLLGIEKARETVNELTESAVEALRVFDGETDSLEEFARAMASRSN